MSLVAMAETRSPMRSGRSRCGGSIKVTPRESAGAGSTDCARPGMTGRLHMRVVQLFVSCLLLGVGVALLLTAAVGSDGYSTFVNGISIATGMPFLAVNVIVGAAFVALAWLRGVLPRWGTLVQPVVVGATVNVLLDVISTPHSWVWRGLLLVAAFPVLTLGVAGYLGSGAGAGPTEGAALAFDPPVPFRWSYSVLQGGGALAGWLMGAAIGPGTVLVVLLLGPAVDLVAARFALFDMSVVARSTADSRTRPKTPT